MAGEIESDLGGLIRLSSQVGYRTDYHSSPSARGRGSCFRSSSFTFACLELQLISQAFPGTRGPRGSRLILRTPRGSPCQNQFFALSSSDLECPSQFLSWPEPPFSEACVPRAGPRAKEFEKLTNETLLRRATGAEPPRNCRIRFLGRHQSLPSP